MTDTPAPLPIAVLAQDLYFLSRIASSLDSAGWRWYAEPEAGSLEAHVQRELPSMLLIDLGARGTDWVSVVQHIRSQPGLADLPVVGFGPHRDLALRDQALAAGFSQVISNSRLFANPAAVVRRCLANHG